eukprot:TRINITY_DN38347_c0_g1_i2.p1 TRINITY_DN38347_c0_g1~~TRINITY_DN38347_c0_g1_i2.p1  ORF type:complete len:405 (+),score=53.51 TRINITY_DN38347_c0_g1_i2:32-1246(+)
MAAPAWLWIAYVGTVSFFIYIWLYGDSNKPNPTLVDRLQRICIAGPLRMINKGGGAVFGEGWSKFGLWFEDYFFGRPNRFFAGCYWVLFVGGYGVFAKNAFGAPMIPCMFVGEWHMWAGSAYCASCWLFFLRMLYSDPGRITQADHAVLQQQFEYDEILYERKNCDTCEWNRPARSKHCRVCNVCVARFDHHCIWINSCVGQGNHRDFILFLIYHGVFMSYVTFVGVAVVVSQVYQHRINEAWYYDAQGQQQPVTHYMLFQWVLQNYAQLFAVTAFTGLLQCLFYGFACYQVSLILRNVTTNETFKLKDLQAAAEYHNTSLQMPSTSPYFVSSWASVCEVFCAPVYDTRKNPREVWDGPQERATTNTNPGPDHPNAQDRTNPAVAKGTATRKSTGTKRRKGRKS